MNLSSNERELVFVLVILTVVGFFYTRGIQKEIAKGEEMDMMLAEEEETIRPFLDIALASKAFAIYDSKNNAFIYKINAEEVMPLASLAKVMSAIIVLENVPADHVFVIDKESLGQIGDNGLLVDEKWGRDELLKFTLVASSNDAIRDIAVETGSIIDPESSNPEKVFIDAMNSRAEEMGLRQMTFFNESGLDLEEVGLNNEANVAGSSKNGAYASARDMAKLFSYAVTTYPDIFSATTNLNFPVSSRDKDHIAKNTNPLVEEIPELLASKTGFTDISGGNLAVALKGKDGATTVVVVLGSTFDERFTDIKTLSGALNPSAN